MLSAATKIQAFWRKHQARVIKDINYQVTNALKMSFGKIEIVQIEGVKKCQICKKDNALRQCGPDVSFYRPTSSLLIV